MAPEQLATETLGGLVIKKQMVMTRIPKYDTFFGVAFEGPHEKGANPSWETVYISTDSFTSMGSPQEITVTVEIGNTL